jgi:hypothetical protein
MGNLWRQLPHCDGGFIPEGSYRPVDAKKCAQAHSSKSGSVEIWELHP